MPHLVEVWNEYSPQGLVMLALSDEAKSTVGKFVDEYELPFPVAAGSNTKVKYGVSGIPAAVLIDHEGTVVWKGHPGGRGWVNKLPELLKQAKAASPAWDAGERDPILAKAVELAKNEDLSGSWKEADKLAKRFKKDEAKLAHVKTFQEDFLKEAQRRFEEIDRVAQSGCYHEAYIRLEKQEEAFKGTPPAKEWRNVLKSWRSDRESKKLMKLDEQRLEALALIRKGNPGKGLKILKKIHEDAEGTPLADVVEQALHEHSS